MLRWLILCWCVVATNLVAAPFAALPKSDQTILPSGEWRPTEAETQKALLQIDNYLTEHAQTQPESKKCIHDIRANKAAIGCSYWSQIAGKEVDPLHLFLSRTRSMHLLEGERGGDIRWRHRVLADQLRPRDRSMHLFSSEWHSLTKQGPP
jgi:hypothetical protein